VDQEKSSDHFHHSESGDVYDLYNACNGVMRGDLLDVRKLDDLSSEELEVLDVVRLREVWDHTASGCLECKDIFQTLNVARGTTRTNGDEPSPKEEPMLKARYAQRH
jgi:hypothetical protein